MPGVGYELYGRAKPSGDVKIAIGIGPTAEANGHQGGEQNCDS
jgi:hypothetical protein